MSRYNASEVSAISLKSAVLQLILDELEPCETLEDFIKAREHIRKLSNVEKEALLNIGK